MKRRIGARSCYGCGVGVPTASRYHACGSNAFYRGPRPRSQTIRRFMDWLSEAEAPPTDVSYGTPVRRRWHRGAGPQ